MSIRRLNTGLWVCECYPARRSERHVRKQFTTKGEALAFERHKMDETEAKSWLGTSVDRLLLKEIVELWLKLYGKPLTAGEHVYDKLRLMVDALGNPLATAFTSKMFAHYRDKRLAGKICFSEKWKKRADSVTINLEQSYLSGVLSELSRLGEWTTPTHWRIYANSPSPKKKWPCRCMNKSQSFCTTANAKEPFWLCSLKSA